MARKVSLVPILSLSALLAGCAHHAGTALVGQAPNTPKPKNDAERIAAAALDQTTWGTVYDPAYVRIPYPNGDVARDRGVCTDVVVRALRTIGVDLQKAIHEDAKRRPGSYPAIKRRDSNIDHRRCPNQMAYFRRYAHPLPFQLDSKTKKEWKPGDIVFWKLPGGKDHVGILSFSKNAEGWPLVVHNIGRGPLEEDVLGEWTLVGRFRLKR